MWKKWTMIVVVVICCGVLNAGVIFDQKTNAIRVTDYPEDMPCGLNRLLQLDQAFGWEKVQYDKEKDTYTVNCDLIIGSNDGTETVFQIGSKEHPKEILIMKGDLTVSPYWVEGENKDKYYRAPKKKNALVLGLKGDKNVNATLKFACTPEVKYTLYCGKLKGFNKMVWGGGLYVYNSTITALTRQPGYEIGNKGINKGRGGNVFLLGSTVLDNAEISWIKQYILGMNDRPNFNMDYLIKDTVFDHIGAPILNGRYKLTGCTVKNCGIAVKDHGSLDAEMIDCVIKNNGQNWVLHYTKKGLTCIDCTIEPAAKKNSFKCWESKRTGKIQFPKFVSLRHIIVEVVDGSGKAVKGAVVKFKAEQEGSEVLENVKFITGADGKTPGKNMEKALLLTQVVEKATETPDQPAVTDFSYTITVKKGEKTASLKNVKADQSWKVVKITLN